MNRIREGKKQRNSNGFHSRAFQLPRQCVYVRGAQRFEHFTVRVDPFTYSETKSSFSKRRRLYRIQIVKLGTSLPADDQDVFEAGGGYQRGARATSLQ